MSQYPQLSLLLTQKAAFATLTIFNCMKVGQVHTRVKLSSWMYQQSLKMNRHKSMKVSWTVQKCLLGSASKIRLSVYLVLVQSRVRLSLAVKFLLDLIQGIEILRNSNKSKHRIFSIKEVLLLRIILHSMEFLEDLNTSCCWLIFIIN